MLKLDCPTSGRRLKDLEKVRINLESGSAGRGDIDVVLLRLVRPSKPERQQVITVDKSIKPTIDEAAEKLLAKLEKYPNDGMGLAVLGSLVEMYLARIEADEATESSVAAVEGVTNE